MLEFLNKQKDSPELFWSLVLEEAWVQAGVWQIVDGAATVIAISPPTAWEGEGELLGAVDTTLSAAVQKLPEGSPEPEKTVFGIGGSWIKGGEIEGEYLKKIKKICEELSLTPTGFVVLPEAIAHFYKSVEGAPINAIIVGLSKEALEVSVFNLGNLVGTASVARSVSLSDDVVEGLSRFEGIGVLPSRIIVFDGREGELEEAKDTLSEVNWEGQEKVKFLHTPKVEVLESDKKILATSLAGASEIGKVSKIKPTSPLEIPETLGFAVDRDVSEEVARPAPAVPVVKMFQPQKYLQGVKGFLGGFFARFKFRPLPIFVVFGVFTAGFVFFWWFYPRAEILIYVTPKKFDQEMEITFDSTNSQVLTTQASGDRTKAASGSKTVGEKAKGTVQVRNGTAFPINLAAGAALISSGNLKFNLDSEASAAAALSPSSPGTVSVLVTAGAIGAEYNLAKDEIFRVGNYPKAEVDATSISDFSGGSSRQISAVSASDREDLLTQLTDELLGRARGELSQKISENQIFVEDFASSKISSEDYSHRVGDEADSIKLSLTLEITGVAADRQKLLEHARGILEGKIPENYVLTDSQISYKFTLLGGEDGNFNYRVLVSANFLPKVDMGAITKQIAGKTPSVTENYLTSIPGFSRAEVTLRPKLPGIFGTIPRIRKNIVVEVAAER